MRRVRDDPEHQKLGAVLARPLWNVIGAATLVGTMAAAHDILGDGYLVHSGASVGGLMIVVTREELRNIGRRPLTRTIVNQFGVQLEGEVGTLRGAVYVTKFGDAAFRAPPEGLVLARR